MVLCRLRWKRVTLLTFFVLPISPFQILVNVEDKMWSFTREIFPRGTRTTPNHLKNISDKVNQHCVPTRKYIVPQICEVGSIFRSLESKGQQKVLSENVWSCERLSVAFFLQMWSKRRFSSRTPVTKGSSVICRDCTSADRWRVVWPQNF